MCIYGRRYVCCGECNVDSIECDEPTPALCNLSVRTVVNLCTLGVLALGGGLGFLNCDDICMCVVNKQFELLEFVFIPFLLTCSMMRFLSVLLLGLCGVCCRPWSVCEVVLYPIVWMWCPYCCLCVRRVF